MRIREQPERALVALLGLLFFFYGLTGLLLSGAEFGGDPIGGTVNGETWLGIEGNAWTFVLFLVAGGVLFGASATRITAKTAAVAIGLLFGAAAVVALVDGDDVLGALAANGATALVWGVAALVLLAIGLAPTAPRKDEATWSAVDGAEAPPASGFGRAEPRDRLVPRRR
jgi:hypothetical protein